MRLRSAVSRLVSVLALATAASGCPASPTPGTPCATDAECAIGTFCDTSGACTFVCRLDEDCGGTERCSARGRCVGSGDAGVPPDARGDAGAACRTAADCDDDVFCNGAEECSPGAAGAGPDGCVTGPAPCASGSTCDETSGTCRTTCDEDTDGNGRADADNDGDAHRSVACGGDDCDDADADRFPRGGAEVCDPAAPAHDEDCNPCTIASFIGADGDRDDDGYVDVGCTNPLLSGDDPATFACPVSIAPYVTVDVGGALVGGTDCDDDPSTGANVHPTESETCNGVDDDCNGNVDEGVMPTWYADVDGDGNGHEADGTSNECLMPSGFSATNDDCGRTDPAIHPGARELCDAAMVSEDCDMSMNEDCACIAGAEMDCTLPYPGCPTARQTCTMNSVGSSWSSCSVSPATVTCYRDSDGDGFAPSGAATSTACACPSGWTRTSPATSTDCDDGRAASSPVASETCNRTDDNCNGTVDDIGGAIVCNGGSRACYNCGNAAFYTPYSYGTQSCNTTTCDWNACPIPTSHWYNPGFLAPAGLSGSLVPLTCPGTASTDGVAVPYGVRGSECGAGYTFGWLPAGEYMVTIANYDSAVYWTPHFNVHAYDYLSGSAGSELPHSYPYGGPPWGNSVGGWQNHTVYRFTVPTCRIVVVHVSEVPHGGYVGGNTIRIYDIQRL